MISPRLMGYGAAAIAIVLMLAEWKHRGAQLESSRAALATANAQVVMMQSEVSSCRGEIDAANEAVQRYREEAEAASTAAAKAASDALRRTRKPLDGHGPAALNAFFEGLR